MDLAAGESLRGAAKGEVAEADLFEVAQAGEDAFKGEGGAAVCGIRRGFGYLGEKFADGELIEFRQGEIAPFPTESFGLEACAAAGGAGVVGAITREEDAHVHLVGILLEP